MDENAKGNKNEFWCENGILYYTLTMPVDEKEAIRLNEGGSVCLDSGAVSRVIIDLQRSMTFSSAARKIWVKFLQNPHIKKTALFGGNVFVRTLASFVIAATNRKHMKFFSSKEEATRWLLE